MNKFALVGAVLMILLASSLYVTVALESAEAMTKGSHHTKASKEKISKSLKKYHATGKTKKQRGE
jgi:hypothetical protein